MPFLHAKIRSGTCKGPLNFKKNQKGFLNADVRDEVWRRKDNVLDWKKSKVLDVNESWNKTFPTNLHPVPESRTSENYVHDRSKAYAYNYRAESLDPLLMDEPIDKPTKFHISRTSSSAALTSQMRLLHEPIQRGQLRRTEEIPVNIKLANKPEWNAMTAVSPKDRNNNMNEFTMKSRSHSKRISTAMSSLDYINPLKSEVIYHATLRRQKTAGTFTPASFLDGVDHRPVDPKDLMNRYAIERPRTYNVVEHSGTSSSSIVSYHHKKSYHKSFIGIFTVSIRHHHYHHGGFLRPRKLPKNISQKNHTPITHPLDTTSRHLTSSDNFHPPQIPKGPR